MVAHVNLVGADISVIGDWVLNVIDVPTIQFVIESGGSLWDNRSS